MSAYGANQRQAAMNAALANMRTGNGVYDAGENRDNQWAESGLQGLQGQNDQSVAQLAAGSNAGDHMAAFRQGADQRGTDVSALLAKLGAAPVQSQSGAFNAAQGQEAARTAAYTNPAIAAGQTAAGLQALGMHDTQNSGAYAQRSAGLARSADALQRLYGLGAALRNQNRAALQNQYALENGQAQMAGNTAMLLGGLTQTAGQGLASYNQNQAAQNWMQRGQLGQLGQPSQPDYAHAGQLLFGGGN